MDKLKALTNENCQGSWKSMPTKLFPNYNGKVTLTTKEVTLLLFVNDERKYKLSFDATADWDGDYLCFKADSKFYIKSANQIEMVFGEFKVPGQTGKGSKWEMKFERNV